MTLDDVDEVSRVERTCFTNPWPIAAYRRELRNPAQNYYIVLRDDPNATSEEQQEGQEANDPELPVAVRREPRRPRRFTFWNFNRRSAEDEDPPIIGFAGMWQLLDEAHVTTIGVHPNYQGRGLGELLFIALIDEAMRRDASWLSLEVRVTNYSAQRLYEKYGFTTQGRRPRYYSDNNEDALIMWSDMFRNEEYRALIERNRRRLYHKLSFEPHVNAT